MTTGTSVAKQVNRILGYLTNYIAPVENTGQEDTVRALYSMHKLYPSCTVITCPAMHSDFFYVSDNSRMVFGYSPQYMMEHFKIAANYFSEIHEADIEGFRDCLTFFEHFLKDNPAEEYLNYRTVLHYRFLNAAGKYIYLQDEKAILVTETGRIVNFSLVRTMPDEMLFSGVKLEIYKLSELLEKVCEYKPSAAKNKLSNRENDLMRLIKKGHTTKEIAWQLSISHNTVRNIKSKLFEKYSVNNSIELLNMAG